MRTVLMTLMKTTHTPHKFVTLLAATLLPLSLSPMVSAQTAPTPSNSTSAAPTCKHEHKGWKNLSDAERQQLQGDLKKIHQDPQLVAARQAVKEAQTPEAKAAAKTSLRQIRNDLLVKVDPSVEPILAKLVHGHKDKDQ